MKPHWRKDLSRLVASVKDAGEADELLAALLSPREHATFSKRWQIVRGLIEGESQRAVRDRMEVSVATVTRGSRELKYGNGTFQKFYERLKGK